jgi:hypothetical protein
MSKAKLRADAINRFIVDAKSQGVYDALKASCVMAGWDSLAGALTPLAGTAPTNSGFLAADYDRGTGLKGNGSTKYLNSNSTGTSGGQNNAHFSVFCTVLPTLTGMNYIGRVVIGGAQAYSQTTASLQSFTTLNDNTLASTLAAPAANSLVGASRNSSANFVHLSGDATEVKTSTSQSQSGANNFYVFSRNLAASPQYSDARLAFYSIGESISDLSVLDALVSRLLADFRSIDEDGMDRDALAYIRNVEAADGGYLELGVKRAIDTFVRGCKYDGIWNAIKASALLCGARTLAGALTPLAGDAPTNNNFVDADYNRETGLKGNGSTKYLNSNYAFPAGLQNDMHLAGYVLEQPATIGGFFSGSYVLTGSFPNIQLSCSATQVTAVLARNPFSGIASITVADTNGFIGAGRADASTVDIRADSTQEADASPSSGVTALNQYMFARNSAGTPNNFFTARVAFYSLGESISDLALLDARVTALVTAIGAAI